MTNREARCPCDNLRASCCGEPARVSVCHCLTCQQRTGSAFSYNMTYPRDRVDVSGSSKIFETISDEANWARHHFCPECGSTVWYEIERRPDMISIPAGAFADPALPEPAFSVYEERKHSWVTIDTAGPLERIF